MIFSKHRKRVGTKRFNSREFRGRIKAAAGYRRLFTSAGPFSFLKFFIHSKNGRRLSVLILIILAYYLFISSTFRVATADVSGNSQVGSEQIAQVLASAGESRIFLIPKNHFLLMSRGYANKLLTKQLPMIKEVSKSRRVWPNGIHITVVERNKGFVLRTNNQDYLVDEEGIVIKSAPEEKDLLTVTNLVEENVAIGEALNPKLAAFVVSLQKQWASKINSQTTAAKIAGKASQEVQFVSAEGWSVLFDINRSVLTQLSNLALILNKQIPAKDRNRLAYIDLRLEKWAYYCYKSSPCEAQAQQNVPQQ